MAEMTFDDIWEIAEKAINDTYKKMHGKGIEESFGALAEESGRDYASACDAYRGYMHSIRENSYMDDLLDSSPEEIYKNWSEWFPNDDYSDELTLKDFDDFRMPF